MSILVMYGFELTGHNHDLVYETELEQYTNLMENQIGYYHDEVGNAWLGYVISICDEDFESFTYDIGILILAQAQTRIKSVYKEYLNEVGLTNNIAALHIINMEN